MIGNKSELLAWPRSSEPLRRSPGEPPTEGFRGLGVSVLGG